MENSNYITDNTPSNTPSSSAVSNLSHPQGCVPLGSVHCKSDAAVLGVLYIS